MACLAPFDGRDFEGAKIAILRGRKVLSLLRDDYPSIPFPNQWDLPGGGREGAETPFETAARELSEELGVTVTRDHLVYHRAEDAHGPPFGRVHFFVARWDDLVDSLIVLGDEGQAWRWFDAREFTQMATAVAPLRARLERALDALCL